MQDVRMAIKKINIRKIKASAETQAQIEKCIELLGWDKRGFPRHVLQGFCKRYRDYYIAIANKESEARGIERKALYEILSDGKDLPGYLPDMAPEHANSPFTGLLLPGVRKENEYALNPFTVSGYNYVIFQLLKEATGYNNIDALSLLFQVHFRDYWTTVYQPQIDRESERDFA